MPPYNSTDPTASFLNISTLDFLLIELVPLAYRVTNELEPPSEESSQESPPTGDSTVASHGGVRRLGEEEEREAAAYRLDMVGYRVGQGIVERFSRDRPKFNETLDAIKFICKDLWSLVFRKQVDNLKTNHRVRSQP
ncbi:related to TRS33 TRAPP subunit of 33 kDa involved in targeting and fusion of ER to golgi transport vesicles [Cephalotrichum gorgonifer]|uniref:Related to TRS33 TRAPP subunit of 33 kDa involved in targeting and fusion of ER to golgi transport vesicles n=1 Tax=Cephalotrichum gorgonifer TaxID=2041049 RepID=A0AAE8MRS5_9PEZI|nr:related to TRS33 TRAPP subunit of 33 kDa involved in targeting and fusion of ER to golgi transport vesicles [Cephalotrichum gorgonifer]